MPTEKKVTNVGKKVVDVASGATPSGAVVRGGKAAAKWALDKYRAYTKAKSDKTKAEAKAKAEKRADELYGKGTSIKPKAAKPEPKPAKPKPAPQPGMQRAVSAIDKRNQRLREESPDKK